MPILNGGFLGDEGRYLSEPVTHAVHALTQRCQPCSEELAGISPRVGTLLSIAWLHLLTTLQVPPGSRATRQVGFNRRPAQDTTASWSSTRGRIAVCPVRAAVSRIGPSAFTILPPSTGKRAGDLAADERLVGGALDVRAMHNDLV